MLATIANCEVPSFFEVVKKLITFDYCKNNQKIFNQLEKFNLLSLFWKYCAEEYGYVSDTPDFEKLIASLFLTHAKSSLKFELPKMYSPYILTKVSNVIVLISTIMNDATCSDYYNDLALKVQNGYKIAEVLKEIDIDKYSECFTFEIVDKNICLSLASVICHMNDSLNDQNLALLDFRREKTHFKSSYENLYRCIDRASHLFSYIKTFEENYYSATDAQSVIEFYTKQWSNIDRYYRQFYFALDNASIDSDSFIELCRLVENVYTNRYLNKLSFLWADKIKQITDYSKLPGKKQWQFFNRVAQPASKDKTVVIISDAFRFECGMQLNTELNRTIGCESNLEYMISSLPSYTKLGMASLLPKTETLTFDDKWNVLIDGKSTIDVEKRANILKLEQNESAAFRFDEIKKMSRQLLRDKFNGLKLIYIYHNQIDARGDNLPSENEVFNACDESIKEISILIRKLSNDISLNHYIVTADHGFIYKSDKLVPSDKVSTGHIHDSDYKNKRFIITREKTKIDGSLCMNLGYLGKNMEQNNVLVPLGTDIFSFPGGGQNFVHGGASLQEIIIPLLKVETSRGKKTEQHVNLEIMTSSRIITNLNTYIDFIQTEPVDDMKRPIQVKVWVEDSKMNKVSNETVIIADRTYENVDQRKFTEKLIFKSKKYNPKDIYYLIMDYGDSGVDTMKYQFSIDIPFAEDFGFGF